MSLATPPLLPGEVIEIVPGVRRVLAPNASPMTGPGTNTYVIGDEELIVIDPGPDDHGNHVEFLADLVGNKLRYITFTHHHSDHAPSAQHLAERTGALVLAWGHPDIVRPGGLLSDGDIIAVPSARLKVLYTPGHATDHCCFLLHPVELTGSVVTADVLFAGDHFFGGSTVSIRPPDGDMTAYFESLYRVRNLRPELSLIAPGHGPLITDPLGTIDGYIVHRLQREAAVEAELAKFGSAAVEDLIDPVYGDSLDQRLRSGAFSNVWAHLRKLDDEHRVYSENRDDPNATWSISSRARTNHAPE